MDIGQLVKDAVYLALVIILAFFLIKLFMVFGIFILVAFVAWWIYKRFIKKDNTDIYRF